MATLFFKPSSWHWERAPGATAAAPAVEEEEEEEEEDTEKGSHDGGRGGYGNGNEVEGNGDEGGKKQESTTVKGHPFVRYGVVVLLAWMFSEGKHLTPFIRLYNSLGWDCLACHPHPLNLHFPSRASTLAMNILLELLKDLEKHPSPVVFVVFSGGHKTCLYKIIQILLGQCGEVNTRKGEFKVVEESIAGLIYDSSPVEFESSIGAKVLSQQVLTLKPGQSSAIMSYAMHAFARGMDFVFSKPLALQKRELWHALYSAANAGPMLVLCSEEDELAPIETIHIFSSNVCRLGGKIDVVAWKDSKHVGHFRRHPEQYTNEVKKLLMRAVLIYSDRIEKHSLPWTELPGTVIAEINQMSRMPHLYLNKESMAEMGGSIVSECINVDKAGKSCFFKSRL